MVICKNTMCTRSWNCWVLRWTHRCSRDSVTYLVPLVGFGHPALWNHLHSIHFVVGEICHLIAPGKASLRRTDGIISHSSRSTQDLQTMRLGGWTHRASWLLGFELKQTGRWHPTCPGVHRGGHETSRQSCCIHERDTGRRGSELCGRQRTDEQHVPGSLIRKEPGTD